MRTFFFIIIGICLVGLLLSFNFQFNKISGDFMSPAFQSGDTILFKKYFMSNPSPKRSAIVVYKRTDNPGVDFVGRIIAMPLEEVRVENGNVYIKTDKSMKMTEDYLSQDTKTQAIPEGEWIKLNEFQYLIVSDNRQNKTIDLKTQLINKNNIRGNFVYKF